MKVIAVTGGIGCGKTEFCNVFKSFGAFVFSGDDEARKLHFSDKQVSDNIKREFGETIYEPNETLYRAKLAAIVFSNPSKLHILNLIIHPKLIEKFHDSIKEEKMKTTKIFVLEAAILLELKINYPFDLIINVTAPLKVRLKYITDRGLSKEQAIARIKRGDPAAPSDTATLLRLHPSYYPRLKPFVESSGAGNSHGVTGGVYKARERIHRGMLIRDY
ncbi:hypothetical protein CHS0354_024050 [Potamilus streckersoni]|uniref:Dephospho-CoA kinase n=1 Tax=Potamilus streckersoni TaxID=2493646 RepID=A0AAE0RZA6_9BIVA|nr:hypothetical protein CHS0354_024050 [Potamilus streckersoni]